MNRDARRIAAVLSVAVATLSSVWASSASACSCVPWRLQRRVLPADGAAGFPTNGTIRVFLEAFPPDARAALAQEYRLRDDAGAQVPLDATVVATRLDLSPRSPLRPNTRYTLEQVFAYDASGVRVSDTERLQRSASSLLRGAWYPVASFQTGPGPASVQARVPAVASAQLRFAYGGGDCGPATAVLVSSQLPPNVADTDVVELRTREQGVIATAPAPNGAQLWAGDMLCDRDPVTLRYQGSLEVQLVLLDASGAELGASPWTTASGTPRGARPRSRPGLASRRAGAWTNVRIVQPTVVGQGPRACSYGFEVTTSQEVASQNAPWMYGAESTLDTSNGEGWLAFASPPSMRLVRVEGDGSTSALTVSLEGIPVTLAAGAGGPIVITHVRRSESQYETRIVALDARGQARWSAVLGAGSGYRLTRGGGRVLVTWSWRTPQYHERVAWALFDERTGRTVRSPTQSQLGVDGDSMVTAAYVGGRFLLAWTSAQGFRAGPTRVAVLRSNGTLAPSVELPFDGRTPELVAAGRRAAIVTMHQGRIRWALLERDGSVAVGPVVVSDGVGGADNRLPRVAYDGRVFAVAWETHPAPGAYVAAVDAQGVVSPALRFDRGEENAGTVGIAASNGGFFGSYTADRARALLQGLRCRQMPPPGAPQRIAPAAP